MPENGIIGNFHNENYFLPPNLPGYGIMIISSADAKFLYFEGRINKFALLKPNDKEINSVVKKINPAQKDILIVNA